MFGRVFELRVDYWVCSCSRCVSPLVSSLIPMSRRLYLGSMCASLSQFPLSSSSSLLAELPPDTRSEDVSKFFDGYGKIIDCRVMTGQSQSYFTPYETHPEIGQALDSSSL